VSRSEVEVKREDFTAENAKSAERRQKTEKAKKRKTGAWPAWFFRLRPGALLASSPVSLPCFSLSLFSACSAFSAVKSF
jgi:hypothetical protein